MAISMARAGDGKRTLDAPARALVGCLMYLPL